MLAATALGQALAGNPDVAVLAGLAFVGIVVARFAGFPPVLLGRAALGLAAVVWATVLLPLPGQAQSAGAHLAAAALVGWLLTGWLRSAPPARRPSWRSLWVTVPGWVLAIGIVWELGELAADIIAPITVRAVDMVIDLGADVLGALLGVALARAIAAVSGRRSDYPGHGRAHGDRIS